MLAVALHAAATWSLYRGWNPEKDVLNVIKPQTVMANLLVVEPQKPKVDLAAIRRAEQRQQAALTKAAQEKAAAEKSAKKRAEQQRAERERAEIEKKQAEQARKEQERLARLARLSELAESSMQEAIAAESVDLQTGSDEIVVRSYHAAIYDLVRANWSRPPSARTGMSTRLQVELIPTGEVIGVTIVDSSGNVAFDRSAEHAVRQATRFEVPEENNLFEMHFRRFYLLFQPEDLLR